MCPNIKKIKLGLSTFYEPIVDTSNSLYNTNHWIGLGIVIFSKQLQITKFVISNFMIGV